MPYEPGNQNNAAQYIAQTGNDVAAGIRQFQQNDLMRSTDISKFYSTAQTDPALVQFLSDPTKAPPGVSKIYQKLQSSGHLSVAEAAQLGSFTDLYTKNKVQQQTQADTAAKMAMEQQRVALQGRSVAVDEARQAFESAKPPKTVMTFKNEAELEAKYPKNAYDYSMVTNPDGTVTVPTVSPRAPVQAQPEIPNPMMEKIYMDLSQERQNLAVPARNAINQYGEIEGLLSGKEGNVISGAWANAELFSKRLGNVLGQDNVDVANTQVLRSLFAVPVANMLKNFGSGSGISDSDRLFAQQAVGGDITMDKPAIERLVKIGKAAATLTLDNYNERLDNAFPLGDNPQDKRARGSLSISKNKSPVIPVVPPPSQAKVSGGENNVPDGVTPAQWSVLTPEQKALWAK